MRFTLSSGNMFDAMRTTSVVADPHLVLQRSFIIIEIFVSQNYLPTDFHKLITHFIFFFLVRLLRDLRCPMVIVGAHGVVVVKAGVCSAANENGVLGRVWDVGLYMIHGGGRHE